MGHDTNKVENDCSKRKI